MYLDSFSTSQERWIRTRACCSSEIFCVARVLSGDISQIRTVSEVSAVLVKVGYARVAFRLCYTRQMQVVLCEHGILHLQSSDKPMICHMPLDLVFVAGQVFCESQNLAGLCAGRQTAIKSIALCLVPQVSLNDVLVNITLALQSDDVATPKCEMQGDMVRWQRVRTKIGFEV